MVASSDFQFQGLNNEALAAISWQQLKQKAPVISDQGFQVYDPELKLGQGLVAEAGTHDEARMAGGATKVHEAFLGEEEDLVASGEGILVHLRLDVGALNGGVALELVDLDLVIEVTNVADDRLVLHALHVLEGDDTDVAGGGDVDVGASERASVPWFRRITLTAFGLITSLCFLSIG